MSNMLSKEGRKSILGQGTGKGKLRRIFQERLVLQSWISLGFVNGLPHKGESISLKGLYDRDFKPRVQRKGEVDIP